MSRNRLSDAERERRRRATTKKYYQKNRKAIREQQSEHYSENREVYKEKNAKYYSQNKHKILSNKKTDRLARALKRRLTEDNIIKKGEQNEV